MKKKETGNRRRKGKEREEMETDGGARAAIAGVLDGRRRLQGEVGKVREGGEKYDGVGG